MSCARPAKGSHVNDSILPCGTLIYGDEKGTRSTRLLCMKCKAELAILERETCPKQP